MYAFSVALANNKLHTELKGTAETGFIAQVRRGIRWRAGRLEGAVWFGSVSRLAVPPSYKS